MGLLPAIQEIFDNAVNLPFDTVSKCGGYFLLHKSARPHFSCEEIYLQNGNDLYYRVLVNGKWSRIRKTAGTVHEVLGMHLHQLQQTKRADQVAP